ncbi:hypothetical protein BZA77DRAFT_364098 [Pyronema omphalodes]|nr:hypothetical protein BZA77DRAFT_364098 [Pyronema omphalodes]
MPLRRHISPAVIAPPYLHLSNSAPILIPLSDEKTQFHLNIAAPTGTLHRPRYGQKINSLLADLFPDCDPPLEYDNHVLENDVVSIALRPTGGCFSDGATELLRRLFSRDARRFVNCITRNGVLGISPTKEENIQDAWRKVVFFESLRRKDVLEGIEGISEGEPIPEWALVLAFAVRVGINNYFQRSPPSSASSITSNISTNSITGATAFSTATHILRYHSLHPSLNEKPNPEQTQALFYSQAQELLNFLLLALESDPNAATPESVSQLESSLYDVLNTAFHLCISHNTTTPPKFNGRAALAAVSNNTNLDALSAAAVSALSAAGANELSNMTGMQPHEMAGFLKSVGSLGSAIPGALTDPATLLRLGPSLMANPMLLANPMGLAQLALSPPGSPGAGMGMGMGMGTGMGMGYGAFGNSSLNGFNSMPMSPGYNHGLSPTSSNPFFNSPSPSNYFSSPNTYSSTPLSIPSPLSSPGLSPFSSSPLSPRSPVFSLAETLSPLTNNPLAASVMNNPLVASAMANPLMLANPLTNPLAMAAVTPAGLPIAALALAGMMAYNTFNASHTSTNSKAPAAAPIPAGISSNSNNNSGSSSSSSSNKPPVPPTPAFLTHLTSHPLLQNLPKLPPELTTLTSNLKQTLNDTMTSLHQPSLDPLDTRIFQVLQPLLFSVFELAWDTRLMWCWVLCKKGLAPVLEGEELRRWVLIEDMAGGAVGEVLRSRAREVVAGLEAGRRGMQAGVQGMQGMQETLVVPGVGVGVAVGVNTEAEAEAEVQAATTVAAPIEIPVAVDAVGVGAGA